MTKHSRVVIQHNHQLIHEYFAARSRVTLANFHQPQYVQYGPWGSFLTEMNLTRLYLTDSYIVFTLKLESGQNFCSNR